MNAILSFNSFYYQFSRQMEKHGTNLLRVSLAIVFIWFGLLKILGMGAVLKLVAKTFFWFPPDIFIPFLGCCEVAIGLGLLIKRFIPITVVLLLIHMAGTFLPFFILPAVCFDAFPYCPSLEGQYIIKNLVLVAATLAISGKFAPQAAAGMQES